MPSVVEEEIRKNDDVAQASGDSVKAIEKEAELSQKNVPIPRLRPPFPQRIVKKIKDGKYCRFISMLKQHSINVPLIEALEKILGYAMLMKYMVTKKSSLSFKDD